MFPAFTPWFSWTERIMKIVIHHDTYKKKWIACLKLCCSLALLFYHFGSEWILFTDSWSPEDEYYWLCNRLPWHLVQSFNTDCNLSWSLTYLPVPSSKIVFVFANTYKVNCIVSGCSRVLFMMIIASFSTTKSPFITWNTYLFENDWHKIEYSF